MNEPLSFLLAMIMMLGILLVGCGIAGSNRRDYEERLIGRWVAISLRIPDESGAMEETTVPDGLYFDFTSGGSFTATIPSKFDEEGHVVASATLAGTWAWSGKLDPKENGGFECAFTGAFPVETGSEEGTCDLLLGKLSQDNIPDNPDALMFSVKFGDVSLTGFATIDGVVPNRSE